MIGTIARLLAVSGLFTGGMAVRAAAADDGTPVPDGTPAVGATGVLVFSGEGDVYTVWADGSHLTQLTTDPADDFDPVWSPDGRQIAFRTTRDGNDEIYLMDADGGNQRNLTNDPAEDWSPAWSPDGKTIAWATMRFGGAYQGGPHTDIAVIDLASGTIRRLTDAHGEYPAWSPDGRKIAFTSGRDGSYDIWVMNADGSDQRNLTHDALYESSAAWSPDGTMLAFDAERGPGDDHDAGLGPDFDIWVMNADGSGQRDLTTDAASEDRFPAWSAAGWIAFNRNGVMTLVRADGSELTPVPGDIHGQFPDWLPAF